MLTLGLIDDRLITILSDKNDRK